MRIVGAFIALVIGSIVSSVPLALDHLPYSILESGYDSGFRFEIQRQKATSIIWLDIGKKDNYRLFLKITAVSPADVKGKIRLGPDKELICWEGNDGKHDGWIEIGLSPSPASLSRAKFEWLSGTRLALAIPRTPAHGSFEAWDLYPDSSFPDSSVLANNRRIRNWVFMILAAATLISTTITFVIQNRKSPPATLDAKECIIRIIAQVDADSRSRTKWVRRILELLMLMGIDTFASAIAISGRKPTVRDKAALYAGTVQFRRMYIELTEGIMKSAVRVADLEPPMF
jgi:hypothetical protein